MDDKVVFRARTRGVCVGVGLMALALGMASTPSVAFAQTVATANGSGSTVTVTIQVDSMPLRHALDLVARQAQLTPVYGPSVIQSQARVTLHMRNAPLSEVMDRLLSGTKLRGSVISGNLLVEESSLADSVQAGIVTGRVVDAANEKPVSGVMVTVDNGKDIVAKTDEKGVFHVTRLSAGTHRLGFRRIGFQATHVAVEVKDGQEATVRVAMSVTAQALNEVVTTALGERRRFEVGNVIGHLNADSIVKAMPVASVTDLLANRIPGVDVRSQNGLVGAATPIRIRGLNSMSLQGDPILIVDGIRQENSAGGRYASSLKIAGTPGAVQSPSRVNDINPADIETIDVLKGPAAVTQYGTDAANGVIIITTKRGKAGPTRWTTSYDHGWSSVPTDFPDIYYNYGHLKTDPTTIVACPFYNNDPSRPSISAGTCVLDSAVHDSPLNHKSTTIYGSGPNDNVTVGVSGGSNAVTYNASGTYTAMDGTIKIPDVLLPMARAMQYPDELLHPNSETQRSARATMSAQLNRFSRLVINAAYTTANHTAPSTPMLTQNMNRLGYRVDSTTNWGYGSPTGYNAVTGLGSLGKERHSGATFGAQVDADPTTWLALSAATSLDHGARRTNDYTFPTAVQVMYNSPSSGGYLSVEDQTTDINSSLARASVNLPLTSLITSHTSGTASVTMTKQEGERASTTRTTVSNNSLAGALSPTVGAIGTQSSTIGGGIQEDLIFAQRLFLTGGYRVDGASGFGEKDRVTGYPSVSLSWVAWDRSGTTVRLRSAYGASGRQPDNGATAQIFAVTSANVNNQVVPGWDIRSVGNMTLRPERTREFEYGVDLGLMDGRFNMELTGYRKMTNDELVSGTLGATFNDLPYIQNLGRVKNTGLEFTLGGSLLQTSSVAWTGTLTASTNANKLLGLAPDYPPSTLGASTQNRVGYPLGSYWAPRVTWGDYNHDGMIDTSEISTTDSSVYLGPSTPKLALAWSSELSVLHGFISVGTSFNRTTGNLIADESVLDGTFGQLPRNLYEQAKIAAVSKGYGFGSLAYLNANYTRWDELHATVHVPAQMLRRLPLQVLSATISVSNLATWTSFNGTDPTATDGGSITYSSYAGYGINNDGHAYGSSSFPTPRVWKLRFSGEF